MSNLEDPNWLSWISSNGDTYFTTSVEVATTNSATKDATTNSATKVATTNSATEVATTNQATEVATTNQATEVATTGRHYKFIMRIAGRNATGIAEIRSHQAGKKTRVQ
jgi:hypothetical protein